MKKIFLLLLFTISCNLYFSQNIHSGSYYYCELVRIPSAFANDIDVAVVLGLKEGYYSPADKKRVENKIDSMATMADAMNFMDTEGWEFLEAYNTSSNSQDYTTRWILRRKRSK